MPVVHSNLIFANSRMRGLSAAVDSDEPQRKAESDLGAGPQGPDGKSAYQSALENGFVGTEVEWLASLQGAPGSDGAQGLSFFQRRVQSVPSASGAVTCNWASYDEIRITLTGDVVLTFSGANDGQGCTLKLAQGGSGGHAVTVDTNVRFSEDITAYSPSTAAGKADRLGFIRDAADNKYDFVSVIKGF